MKSKSSQFKEAVEMRLLNWRCCSEMEENLYMNEDLSRNKDSTQWDHIALLSLFLEQVATDSLHLWKWWSSKLFSARFIILNMGKLSLSEAKWLFLTLLLNRTFPFFSTEYIQTIESFELGGIFKSYPVQFPCSVLMKMIKSLRTESTVQ